MTIHGQVSFNKNSFYHMIDECLFYIIIDSSSAYESVHLCDVRGLCKLDFLGLIKDQSRK